MKSEPFSFATNLQHKSDNSPADQLDAEMMAQIRRLQIYARRTVSSYLSGEFASVFRGQGLMFDEVRAYQIGDDVRSIDWNVSARMNETFVKRFIEEREQNIFLLVDISQSLNFSTERLTKRQIAAELAALIAYSALDNRDKIGLLLFSDQIEKVIPVGTGTRHIAELIRHVLVTRPTAQGTSIATALKLSARIIPKRSIVILISDFLDDSNQSTLESILLQMSRKFELIALQLIDPREEVLPPIGWVSFASCESTLNKETITEKSIHLTPSFCQKFAESMLNRKEVLQAIMKKAKIDFMQISSRDDHLRALIRFFQLREHRRVSS